MKITVVGAGYVGLSLAILFSKKHNVTLLDILPTKIEMINNRISPIKDYDIDSAFKQEDLQIFATTNYKKALYDSNVIFICTPTDYDPDTGGFDTTSVEDTLEKIKDFDNKIVVIKSTVPVGFTSSMNHRFNTNNILFSPEFLREGKALYDNLYPSRIVVGGTKKMSCVVANLLKSSCLKKDVLVKYMSNDEAEAVKLFANTYLALRVSFFNELDTYSELKKLNTENIIEGVCLDQCY